MAGASGCVYIAGLSALFSASVAETTERGRGMMNETKSPLAATSGQGTIHNRRAHPTKPPQKWKRVLAAMAEGRSYNRFEAERVLSDHCLHSTVSTIQGKGIRVERRDEVVPGYQGIPTHVCRYWLGPSEREKAAALLGWRLCPPRS